MAEILRKVAMILIVLFVFGFAGFALRKAKLVGADSLFALSNILLYLCQPMLSVKAFAVDPMRPTGPLLWSFLWVALITVAVILVLFAVSTLVFRFTKDREKRDVLVFISTFSNCTFVGLPFIDMFTDGNAEAMMDIIVFGAVFNVLLWTLGAYLITHDKRAISLRRAIFNPSTIGSLIGFLLFLVPRINIFELEATRELQQIVVFTGNMTAPLSMLVVGVRLAELTPRELFGDGRIYLAAFLRLVVSFGLTYLLLLPFKLTGVFAATPYVILAPVIAMSMPPASTVVAFSEKYGGDRRFTAAAFCTATLLSAVTLPFAMLLVTL